MRVNVFAAAAALFASNLCANLLCAETITLSEKVQIPGAVLKPGEYVFAVEDRLPDRAIVRITEQNGNKYELLLTVADPEMKAGTGQRLVFFNSAEKKQILRGWVCPDCAAGLEFVYSKAEAAKITETTREPVLAVDPEYDKLPANLSPDDMKVVTLWLLSPKPVTANDPAKGVIAQKYAGPPPSTAQLRPQRTETRSENSTKISSAPALAPSHENLPGTASNIHYFGLAGLLLIFSAAGMEYLLRSLSRR